MGKKIQNGNRRVPPKERARAIRKLAAKRGSDFVKELHGPNTSPVFQLDEMARQLGGIFGDGNAVPQWVLNAIQEYNERTFGVQPGDRVLLAS